MSAVRLPLGQESMPANDWAWIIGTLLQAACDAGMAPAVHGCDNASYISLADGCYLQHKPSLDKARDEGIPFLLELKPAADFRKISHCPFGASEHDGEVIGIRHPPYYPSNTEISVGRAARTRR